MREIGGSSCAGVPVEDLEERLWVPGLALEGPSLHAAREGAMLGVGGCVGVGHNSGRVAVVLRGSGRGGISIGHGVSEHKDVFLKLYTKHYYSLCTVIYKVFVQRLKSIAMELLGPNQVVL